jgi:hypothetical protein
MGRCRGLTIDMEPRAELTQDKTSSPSPFIRWHSEMLLFMASLAGAGSWNPCFLRGCSADRGWLDYHMTFAGSLLLSSAELEGSNPADPPSRTRPEKKLRETRGIKQPLQSVPPPQPRHNVIPPTLGARPSRRRDRYTTPTNPDPVVEINSNTTETAERKEKRAAASTARDAAAEPLSPFITPFAAGDAASCRSLPAVASPQMSSRPELSPCTCVHCTGLEQITRQQLYRLSVCNWPPAMQPWPTRKIWRVQWRSFSGCPLGTRPEAHSRGHVLQKHGNNWVRGMRRNGG